MKDPQTISVYQEKADTYASLMRSNKPGRLLREFMEKLENGAKILDLGCGPGHDSAHMANAGFDVLAVDASEEMIKLATKKTGFRAEVRTFDELTEQDEFDAVWANFSLLHASREDFPRHISAIEKCLKTSGVFGFALKTGTGEKRDQLGRFYTYYTEEDLNNQLSKNGFKVLNTNFGEDAGMAGNVEPWISILAEK